MECARFAAAAPDASSSGGHAAAAPSCAGPSAAEVEARRAIGAFAASGDPEGAAAVAARAAVAAWVRRLRDRGVPPERALIAVKRAARHALAPGLDTAVGARPHDDAEARLAEVVRWCIVEYYR